MQSSDLLFGHKNSLALIGMPGVGKSTIAKRLALTLDRVFIDTDQLIEREAQCSLQDVIDKSGYQKLRLLEEQVIVAQTYEHAVIATGGSVIHSQKALAHLQQSAYLVYLEASIETLVDRIDNWDSRGIACDPKQSFQSLYSERTEAYSSYADCVINSDGLSPDKVVDAIISWISELV